MASQTAEILDTFDWTLQPEAALFVERHLEAYCRRSPAAQHLRRDLLAKTGTRLIDWTDHLVLPQQPNLESELRSAGFTPSRDETHPVWRHAGGLFPSIEMDGPSGGGLVIKVESVADFLVRHHIDNQTRIEGAPRSSLRRAEIASESETRLSIVERHGYRGRDPVAISAGGVKAVLWHAESFRRRRREFASQQEGFDHAAELIRRAIEDLGAERACDLFFAAEREYWTSRNRAAQVQLSRQNAMGLGWANHDHHTYRSSRKCFPALIGLLEELGLTCRERFYAGREAGWGAQVLQQLEASIVVFADVDLAAHEVSGDFAHQRLAPRESLETVGLWCELHGEAFLQAGMHHLECRFDFDAAREQLRRLGITTMKPFTDLAYLKQAFTEGEIWPVKETRIEAALDVGAITPEQAGRFRDSGAIGSHLEILQRDEGYQGFNKAGISEIIRDTDPRHRSAQST